MVSLMDTYLNKSAVLLVWAGSDTYDTPNDPTEVDVKIKVDWKDHVVRDEKGEDIVATGKVTIGQRSPEITLKDKLRITGVVHQILKTTEITDFDVEHIMMDIV